jgi:hypothetical protein
MEHLHALDETVVEQQPKQKIVGEVANQQGEPRANRILDQLDPRTPTSFP